LSGAEAHGQQASYDENKGTIAPQGHVLPARVIVPSRLGSAISGRLAALSVSLPKCCEVRTGDGGHLIRAASV